VGVAAADSRHNGDGLGPRKTRNTRIGETARRLWGKKIRKFSCPKIFLPSFAVVAWRLGVRIRFPRGR